MPCTMENFVTISSTSATSMKDRSITSLATAGASFESAVMRVTATHPRVEAGVTNP